MPEELDLKVRQIGLDILVTLRNRTKYTAKICNIVLYRDDKGIRRWGRYLYETWKELLPRVRIRTCYTGTPEDVDHEFKASTEYFTDRWRATWSNTITYKEPLLRRSILWWV